MEYAAGSRAGSGNIAAVLRNPRFHKNNIQHWPSPQNRTFGQNYPCPLARLLYAKSFSKSIQKIHFFELFIVFTKKWHLGAKICEFCGLDFDFPDTYPQITGYCIVKIHNNLKMAPYPPMFWRIRFNKVYKFLQTPPWIPAILNNLLICGNLSYQPCHYVQTFSFPLLSPSPVIDASPFFRYNIV